MGKSDITIDTHSLLWYLDSDYNKRLSRKAYNAIYEAEISGQIFIPMIVLAEALHQIDKGRFNITFDRLMFNIKSNEAYEIMPFNENVLEKSVVLKGLEIHDRLILATAILMDTSLVSADVEISKVYDRVIW
jgi:PIN domain nuclease of toxin-antitoxin system